MLLLLLQAAQTVAPVAPLPAPSPHTEPWIYLAAAALGPLSLVLLGLIRRGSNAKAIAAEKTAKEALALAQAHATKLVAIDDQLTENQERINDVDERLSNTDPNLRSRDERMDRIEKNLQADQQMREERRKEQANQELKLVETLTRLETNLINLTKQVEDGNRGRRRN